MARKKIQDANGVETEVEVAEVTPEVTIEALPEPVIVQIVSNEPVVEGQISEQTRLEMEAGRAALAAYASRV